MSWPTDSFWTFLQACWFENVTVRCNKIVLESFIEVTIVSKEVRLFLFPHLKQVEKYCADKIDKFDKNR